MKYITCPNGKLYIYLFPENNLKNTRVEMSLFNTKQCSRILKKSIHFLIFDVLLYKIMKTIMDTPINANIRETTIGAIGACNDELL